LTALREIAAVVTLYRPKRPTLTHLGPNTYIRGQWPANNHLNPAQYYNLQASINS